MGKRVTVEDIARELGISSMTVSRALNNRPHVNEVTREKVLQTAKRLGYVQNHIAKSLVLRKTNVIGIVIPKISHFFFSEVIRGIESVTFQHGYQLLLTHSAENTERESQAIRTLESQRVDGILISTAQNVADYDVYRQALARNTPLVFFDRCAFDLGASCVHIDDRESARLLADHFVQHGYRRIAHLAGPPLVSIGKERLEGYRLALDAHGIPYDESLVVTSGFNERGGYEAMVRLLEQPDGRRPEAVVAVNDPAAFGAMKAINNRGLTIPGDIAVGGFTDDPRAEMVEPGLTTIRQPAYEIGVRAAEQIITHINTEQAAAEDIIISGQLVIRRSCGCRKEDSVPVSADGTS